MEKSLEEIEQLLRNIKRDILNDDITINETYDYVIVAIDEVKMLKETIKKFKAICKEVM